MQFRTFPVCFVPFCLLAAVTAFGAVEPAGQVVGFYNNGKLVNANALQPEGKGYVELFQWRNRGWGSQGLVDFIQNIAEAMSVRFPEGERLQIGDLSGEQGGPISGHTSHQNGLDVDFVYFRMNRQEQPQEYSPVAGFFDHFGAFFRILGFQEEFVVNGKLTRNFDLERNWAFVRLMVSSERINRIFVDPVIKKSLCSFSSKIGNFEEETLRRLRPLDNHGDHYHVRLTCPVESPDCLAQDAIPAGSGCNGL